jgi:hypothetical protein
MWDDPIVEEVRQARDAFAARFNYDLHAMCEYLREQDRKSGRKVVDLSKAVRKDEPAPAKK